MYCLKTRVPRVALSTLGLEENPNIRQSHFKYFAPAHLHAHAARVDLLDTLSVPERSAETLQSSHPDPSLLLCCVSRAARRT